VSLTCSFLACRKYNPATVDNKIEAIDKTVTVRFKDIMAYFPTLKHLLSSISKAKKITETAVLHHLCPLSANGN
jgi:hypothetical protein